MSPIFQSASPLRRIACIAVTAWLAASCAHVDRPATPTTASGSDTLVLERMVMLMRHGVRPPTKSPPVAAGLARDPWPHWDVPPGQLTAHGFEGAVLVGQWNRQSLSGRGLVPDAGCPDRDRIAVRANTDQRTRETARAFLMGFAPGCDIPVAHSAGHRDDPIFQSIDLGLVEHDRDAAQAAVMARVDGDLGTVTGPLADAFARLDAILDCCAPPACTNAGLRDGCTLSTLPTRWADTAPGKRVKFDGPLDAGGVAAHTLLLEFVEGKPMAQVGWGRASEADITLLSRIHAAEFDLLHRTPYIASRGATPILERVLATFADDSGPALDLLVGHDTNAANVGGALGLHWQVPGYAANDPAVGGALGFELLHDATGARFVRVSYQAQATRQLRELQPLDDRNPPYIVYMEQPLCGLPSDATTCRYDGFVTALRARIVR